MTEPLSTRLSARSEASVRFPSGYHTGGAFKHVRVCGGSSAQSAPDGHVTGGADEVGARAGFTGDGPLPDKEASPLPS